MDVFLGGKKKNWNRVITGLAFFGGEIIWEMTNALICYFSGYAGLWVTPGDTAFLILIGLTIEISIFFAFFSLIVFNFLDAFEKDEKITILGKKISNRRIVPFFLALGCVFVEVILNFWGALVWEWPFWNWPNIYLQIVAYSLPVYFITWFYDNVSLKFKIKATVVEYIVLFAMFISLAQLRWI